MGKYNALYSYIDFLETATEESVTEWVGIPVKNGFMPYASYDSRITGLIDEFYKSDLVDGRYSGVLGRQGNGICVLVGLGQRNMPELTKKMCERRMKLAWQRKR